MEPSPVAPFPIISADSHVTEAPGTYVDHIDPAFRDRCPRLVDAGPENGDIFVTPGMGNIALGTVAAAGKRPEEIRLKVFPRSRLRGEANLLIMPTLDAANISFNLLKTAAGGGVTVGPMLLGAARPVHILTPSASVRRIVNMTALVVADANAPRGQEQTLF